MNRATRAIVATLGTIFGISGMSHGFFETLQGNTSTGNLFISAIGEAQKMWPHGNEPAFTLIPNFLMTGIAAMIVGLAIVIWSLGARSQEEWSCCFPPSLRFASYGRRRRCANIILPWIWLVSTRIHQPLVWWRKVLPIKIQKPLGKLWTWLLMISSALLVFVLEIAVTGFVPTVNDPETVLSVMLLCLLAEAVVLPLTFISGFAYDIAMRHNIALDEK